jgi:hypothetical protein
LAAPVSEAATPSGSFGSDDGTPGTQAGVVPADAALAELELVELLVEPLVELLVEELLLLQAARPPPKTRVKLSAPTVRKGRIRISESLPWRPDRYLPRRIEAGSLGVSSSPTESDQQGQ